MQNNSLEKLLSAAKQYNIESVVKEGGIVCGINRDAIMIKGLCDKVSIGQQVIIHSEHGRLASEVIRVDEETILVKPFNDTLHPKLEDYAFVGGNLAVRPDISWCGRVINAIAAPLDGLGPLKQGDEAFAIDSYAVPAMQRERVGKPLATGVNAIDVFTPLCFGQRIGIFAGSGVGKSTLLAMMTQTEDFDIIVLALTGERGREVRDMLDGTLEGKTGKIITVVATGDESAMMRRLAPVTATTIAECFSAQGKNVLLIVDSITRYALGAREIAIAALEPPVARGYPPSVFSQLARLLERAGPGTKNSGSITGIYSVLIDGDDHNDPIADAIRGIVDGHIVLDRAIASRGRFPAIDLLHSISRLARECWSDEQKKLVQSLKEMIALYEESRDLRAMGMYKAGGDAALDRAIEVVPLLYEALSQDIDTVKTTDPYEVIAKKLRSA